MESIKATIRGEYQWPSMTEPKQFEVEATFTLLPPAKGEAHYGTGCYMTVKIPHEREHYVDVRYERTRDLKELARRWIEGYYGENLREYCFE